MIYFSIALSCEAQPLIQRYQMKPCGNHGRTRFFAGEQVRLAITGVGALPCAIGTTALGKAYPEAAALWINIGICGHASARIGKAFIGNRIASDSSRDRFYPSLPWKSPWPGIEIKSLSAPSISYEESRVFDMEAFAFTTAALHFAPSERVHSIKVVSDNAENPAHQPFDKAAIAQLISNQLPELDHFIAEIGALCPRPNTPWADRFARDANHRFAFTETERHQLASRLFKLDILLGDPEKAALQTLLDGNTKKSFLSSLQRRIDSAAANTLC